MKKKDFANQSQVVKHLTTCFPWANINECTDGTIGVEFDNEDEDGATEITLNSEMSLICRYFAVLYVGGVVGENCVFEVVLPQDKEELDNMGILPRVEEMERLFSLKKRPSQMILKNFLSKF